MNQLKFYSSLLFYLLEQIFIYWKVSENNEIKQTKNITRWLTLFFVYIKYSWKLFTSLKEPTASSAAGTQNQEGKKYTSHFEGTIDTHKC